MPARYSLGTLVVLSMMGLAGCGGGGSSAPPAPLPNPVPTIAALSPNNATRGGPDFILTVNGSNFVSGASVQGNGSNRFHNIRQQRQGDGSNCCA
jgi:hypothetical protein